MSISRFLVPRGLHQKLHHPFPPQFKSIESIRNASTRSSPASKPRTLEKPAKFNPPSHGARLNKSPPRNYPGPALSSEAKAERATKQYPNMMPAEGTFMYWFLTNRGIHMWITLSTLFFLALYTLITDFRLNSPFAYRLPPLTDFGSHPIETSRTWFEVYKMHSAHISAETAERRKRKVSDVVKRAEYRKAHGLDQNQGFGGWTAKREGEEMGPAIPTGDAIAHEIPGKETNNGDVKVEDAGSDDEVKEYLKRKGRHVKKWFGIW